jgi:2-dehydro-3-deoxyphosphogalactonate aldolase
MTETAAEAFVRHFAVCPLIAILRGIRPDEVVAMGEALIDAGITILEVPLNSPEPCESITRLCESAGARALVGAGTVIGADAVARVAGAGGLLMLAPNTDAATIAAAIAGEMMAIPGFFTPTEAFAALHAGADALKYFPAEAGSPAALKAMRAVLPRSIPIIAVGGITPDNLPAWRAAGADGFGLGSALYRPGTTPAVAAQAARRFIEALGDQTLSGATPSPLSGAQSGSSA